MPTLEVRQGKAGYADLQVLFGVDISIKSGTVTAILGPNGAGKSTLLGALSGLVPFWAGSTLLDGRDVTRLSAAARVRAGITLVPQGRDLFGPLTVRENLELGAFVFRLPRNALRARIDTTLGLFPALAARLHEKAESLSGGQQQMLAIGRALMGGPQFLLIDEPSQGLGPLVVESVLQSLVALARDGTGVVLAEQDGNAGLKVADACYVVRSGAIVWSGTKADAVREGVLMELYFGGK
ncbi:MAG: ABC transporter ATP-binding protein [Vulcanimicrobiaceae bacterium]